MCKKVRLMKDGDKFQKEKEGVVERTRILVNESEFKNGNKNWDKSGRLYIIDKEATAERDKIVSARDNEVSQGGEIDVLRKILDEKGIKYDKRSGVKKLKEQIEE